MKVKLLLLMIVLMLGLVNASLNITLSTPKNNSFLTNNNVNFTWNITSIITTSSSTDPIGLTNYYTFDESSGSNVYNNINQSHNGTVSSSPAWVTGKINNSFQFDGTNYIDADTHLGPEDLVNFSVFMWVNITTATLQSIYDDASASDSCGVNLRVTGSGTYGGASLAVAGFDSGVTLSDSQWHFIGLVITSDGYWHVYHNAVEVYTSGGSFSSNISACTGIATRIGALRSGPWKMTSGTTIDELSTWNRSISSTEISNLYNSGSGSRPTSTTTYTYTPVNLTNSTIYVYNSSQNLVNQTFIELDINKSSQNISSLIFLPDEIYNWFTDASDINNNYTVTSNYTFTIDNTYPLISFTYGTEPDGSNKSQTFILANVTYTETNFKNITYNLYSINSSLLSDTTYTTQTTNHTWTGLSDSLYYYDVRICDQVNHCNSTETRSIVLDTVSPTVNLMNPNNNNISTSSTNTFIYNFTDGTLSSLIVSENLLDYWTLDETSGTNAYNSLRQTNNGTVSSSPDWTTGKINNSFRFNGANYIDMPLASRSTGTEKNFSVFMWVNITSNAFQQLYIMSNPSDSCGVSVRVNSGTGDLGGASLSLAGFSTGSVIADSQWHYVGLVVTPDGYYHFYNDNVEVYTSSGDYSQNLSACSNMATRLGATRSNTFYISNGQVDEVSVWNKALNSSEISTLYNSSFGSRPVFSTVSYSATASGVQNSTLYIYENSTNVLVNKTTSSSFANIFNSIVSIPVTLADGIYKWFANAFDFAGNQYTTNNYTIGIDTTFPQIRYGSGMITDYSNISSSMIFINVTGISANVQNITYELYNNFFIQGNCHQETANSSFATDGDCNLNYNGYYQGDIRTNLYDGDYSTSDSTNSTGLYIFYVPPTGSLNTSNWSIKDSGYHNLSLTGSDYNCWNTSLIQLRVITSGGNIFWECLNQSSLTWKTTRTVIGSTNVFEEGMYWNFNTDYSILNRTTRGPTQTSLTWYGLPDNKYSYRAYATSLTNQINYTAIKKLILDSTPPNTTQISPVNPSVTNNGNVNFIWNVTDRSYNNITNLTFDGTGMITSTLWVYNGSGTITNLTTVSSVSNIFSTIISIPVTLVQGIYNWFVSAIDFAGNIFASGNSSLTVDLSTPTLTLYSPQNTTYTDAFVMSSNTTMTINWTVTDSISGLQSCWYILDGGSNNYVTCHSNITYVPISYGQHNLTFYANDTAGNLVGESVLATWKYIMITNSISYSPTAYELSSQTFLFNSTLDTSITGITMNFNYNNTNQISTIIPTGNNTIFRNIVITPPVNKPTNVSFYWNFTASDGISTYSVNSNTYQQTVNPIMIGLCNSSLSNMIYNFTCQDEDSLQRIRPYYFGGTFGYSINGTFKKTVTISNISDEIDICYEPSTTPINLDVYITYGEDKNITNFYNNRNFVLQNHLKYNVTEQVNLTLLNNSQATEFTLKVQDSDLVPLANYVINTYRLNPSTGTFYLTQSGKTDSNGLTSGFFEINTVDYYFVITYQDEVKLTTSPAQKVIPQSSPPTLVFTINPTATSPFSQLTNITDFNFTFYNTSIGVAYEYVDTSANFEESTLLVYLLNYSGPNTLVCNTSSVLVSDTLNCNFNNVNGTYTAIAYLTRNGQQLFVKSVNLIFPFGGRGWGLYGVFLGFLLILVSAFMFKYNEIAGIWSVVIAIIFVQMIGFINFGITFITAMIAIAGILTVVMKQ